MVQIVFFFDLLKAFGYIKKLAKSDFFLSEKKYNTSDMYELPSYIITMIGNKED